MTVSFHKYDNGFFPGTGEIFCNGRDEGKVIAINVPLLQGIDDESYNYFFEQIVCAAVEKFNPDIIILQNGAGSLKDDRIAIFNLTIHGHGRFVRFIKKLAKKLLVLGRGGYNVKKVVNWVY